MAHQRENTDRDRGRRRICRSDPWNACLSSQDKTLVFPLWTSADPAHTDPGRMVTVHGLTEIVFSEKCYAIAIL